MAEIALAVLAMKKKKKDEPEYPTDKDAEEAARKRSEELRRRKGRGASILTGGEGITQEPTLGKPSLLGSL